MTRSQQQPLRYISNSVFQKVDDAIHLINPHVRSGLVISRVDRVSHPFDHPGPYTEERGSCPCLTHVAQRRLVRRTKFTALSLLRVMNLSTCRPQAQARRRRKQVCNILKHFYKLLNLNIWIYWIRMIEFDIIWSHFLLTLLFLHARNVQLDFCVFEELCFALFLDSGFRIPDSGFRIPVSGFRLLALPCLHK